MVLFNQILDGEAAAKRGLAWECVDDDILIETAVNLASEAASHPPELVAKTKATLSETSKTFDSISSVELEGGTSKVVDATKCLYGNGRRAKEKDSR